MSSAVHAGCDRCGAPIRAEGDPAAVGFGLCDDCIEVLAGDAPATEPDRPPAVTPAEALAGALDALLCRPFRSGPMKRRWGTPGPSLVTARRNGGRPQGRPGLLPS